MNPFLQQKVSQQDYGEIAKQKNQTGKYHDCFIAEKFNILNHYNIFINSNVL